MSQDARVLLPELRRTAQESLKDTTRFAFFDEADAVLCSSFKARTLNDLAMPRPT